MFREGRRYGVDWLGWFGWLVGCIARPAAPAQRQRQRPALGLGFANQSGRVLPYVDLLCPE